MNSHRELVANIKLKVTVHGIGHFGHYRPIIATYGRSVRYYYKLSPPSFFLLGICMIVQSRNLGNGRVTL